jgi:hypothetical protein
LRERANAHIALTIHAKDLLSVRTPAEQQTTSGIVQHQGSARSCLRDIDHLRRVVGSEAAGREVRRVQRTTHRQTTRGHNVAIRVHRELLHAIQFTLQDGRA